MGFTNNCKLIFSSENSGVLDSEVFKDKIVFVLWKETATRM